MNDVTTQYRYLTVAKRGRSCCRYPPLGILRQPTPVDVVLGATIHADDGAIVVVVRQGPLPRAPYNVEDGQVGGTHENVSEAPVCSPSAAIKNDLAMLVLMLICNDIQHAASRLCSEAGCGFDLTTHRWECQCPEREFGFNLAKRVGPSRNPAEGWRGQEQARG